MAREVLLGHLPRRLDGLGTAGGEEDPVEVAGGEHGQPLGELDRPRVGVGPQREVGELGGLPGARLGHLGPAVPDLADEQARQPVQVALAPGVVDVLAGSPHDRRHVGAGVGGHPGEVQPEVAVGRCLQRVRVHVTGGMGTGHLVPQL